MEVFVFLRNVNKSLLYPDASAQMDLIEFVHNFGIIKFVEFFGSKYCAMLLYVIPCKGMQFPMTESVLDIQTNRYTSKIFFEYRQFKNFIVNLEKRFMLISIHEAAYFQPFNTIQKTIGKMFLSKVNSKQEYLMADPTALLHAYPGIILQGGLFHSISTLNIDPNQHSLCILEAYDKKTCLTNRKINLLARSLSQGSTVFRVKLFESLIENLIYLPKIRKLAIASNHFEKPTNSNYHSDHRKVGPKNSILDRPTIEVYYRFNHAQQ
jgi:hypothetical protein